MSFITVPLSARYLRRQNPVSSMAKNSATAPLLMKDKNSYTGPSLTKSTPMAPAQIKTAGNRISATIKPAEGALGLVGQEGFLIHGGVLRQGIIVQGVVQAVAQRRAEQPAAKQACNDAQNAAVENHKSQVGIQHALPLQPVPAWEAPWSG